MDLEQLIAEVNRITGVRLTTTEPILGAGIINEILLDKALAKFDRQVKAQVDRVTVASAQGVVDAKKEAEALLSDATDWVEARFKAASDTAAASVLVTLRQETEKAEQAKRVTIRAASETFIVGLVVLPVVRRL